MVAYFCNRKVSQINLSIMRKLKVQVQISIDGFIAGPNGEMDWMNFNWSDDLKQYVTELTSTIDTILLGRKLAEGFIPYWTESLKSDSPADGADVFVNTPKVVFTKTLNECPWDHTSLAKGELREEILALKQREGKDIITYGGAGFLSALIEHHLIDELHLFINPTAIGKGLPIFQQLQQTQQYSLLQSRSFDCGIVVLTYQPA